MTKTDVKLHLKEIVGKYSDDELLAALVFHETYENTELNDYMKCLLKTEIDIRGLNMVTT